jgi:O-antigen/teichoic acid export membrane protein
MPGNDTASTHAQPQRSGASVAARGTIELLVARGCFLVSGYLIAVILARGLGPLEYGVYGVVMSLLVWLEMLGSIGVPGAMTKRIPQLLACVWTEKRGHNHIV